MKNLYRLLALSISLSLLSACAISKHIVPVDSTKRIDKIYVLENKRVFMDDFHGELLSQLQALGYETETYTGDLPAEAKYHMTYTANWTWDLAMYLVYFRANLYDDGRAAGEIEYDAKMGGANLGKFGRTADIIRPLIHELFAKVPNGNTSTTYYAPPSQSTMQAEPAG